MVYFFIFAGAILRILPHPPNFAPITALALFGGTYLGKKYALLVPLAAMLISDFFLGFHQTMPYVYGSFLVIGLIGLWLRNHKKIGTIFGATIISSILFYLVTNYGVWAIPGSIYPPTLSGLGQSFLMGLPFLRNTILGDLFYVGIMFGAYEGIKWLVAKRVLKKAEVKIGHNS